MNYKIEIGLRNCLPPVQFRGETDEEFEARYLHWETEDKDKSFWRMVIMDGDGITAHHFAVQSALFHNSEDGSKELKGIMEHAGIALSERQASKKRIAESVEIA